MCDAESKACLLHQAILVLSFGASAMSQEIFSLLIVSSVEDRVSCLSLFILKCRLRRCFPLFMIVFPLYKVEDEPLLVRHEIN
jgi:hypothetical protein